jgi:hypothetical protein
MAGGAEPEVVTKEKKLELPLLGQPLSEKTRTAVLEHADDSSVTIQAAREFQAGGKGGGPGAMGGVYDPALAAIGVGQRNAPLDDRQAAVMAGLLLGSPEFQKR